MLTFEKGSIYCFFLFFFLEETTLSGEEVSLWSDRQSQDMDQDGRLIELSNLDSNANKEEPPNMTINAGSEKPPNKVRIYICTT